jgi:non-ribosomal peptide synthetase component F
MASNTYMSHMYGPRITPRFPTVTAAFYHQVATQPEVVAARDFSSPELRQITYHELSQRASRLARKLRQLGVVPGDMVPLVVKRGIDMLVGIVAVLSCGAQYVPLDGGVVPDSTLRHVISQTGGSSSTVLVLKTTKYRVEDSGVANIVAIDERDEVEEDLYTQSLPPQDLAENHHGCYVIYTSGMSP